MPIARKGIGLKPKSLLFKSDFEIAQTAPRTIAQ